MKLENLDHASQMAAERERLLEVLKTLAPTASATMDVWTLGRGGKVRTTVSIAPARVRAIIETEIAEIEANLQVAGVELPTRLLK